MKGLGYVKVKRWYDFDSSIDKFLKGATERSLLSVIILTQAVLLLLSLADTEEKTLQSLQVRFVRRGCYPSWPYWQSSLNVLYRWLPNVDMCETTGQVSLHVHSQCHRAYGQLASLEPRWYSCLSVWHHRICNGVDFHQSAVHAYDWHYD